MKISKITIIQEYDNEMKENSYIIVVLKALDLSILVFAASKLFIRSLSYKELKF